MLVNILLLAAVCVDKSIRICDNYHTLYYKGGGIVKKAVAVAAILVILFVAVTSPGINRFLRSAILAGTAVNVDALSENEGAVSFKKGDYVLFGRYLGEPILWKVVSVEGGRPLLVSERILCLKAFDASGNCAAHTGKDTVKFGSSAWETSTLRTWLNSAEENVAYPNAVPSADNIHEGYNAYDGEKGFLHSDNFSAEALEMIADDGVFILTKAEVLKYIPENERAKACTKSALLASDAPYLATTAKKTWYWTASPISTNNVSVAAVTSGGGFYKSLAYDGASGVCPALYLRSGNAEVFAGGGTADNPLLIEEAL